MPEEFEDTQATEESSQSTSEMPSEGSQDALESTGEQETVDSSSEASDASEGPSEAQKEVSQEPTEEELGQMSDEEFLEYVNSGKMPQKKESQAQDTAQVQEEPVKAKAQKPSQDAQQPQVNYEDVVKQIFAPFKANGKEIAPRTVEDVVQLMQMGANYTKKMQSIAPMRKAVESLSNAGIDSEEKLSYLIDLYKGDKEAIKQLLKNNQIDAMDLDLDEINYNPNRQNIASDADVKFAETLSNINESLPQIQNIIDKQWDAESKKILLSDPRALQALHEEIQMGRFEPVQKQLEVERTFGRYQGVPDIQAYIDILNRMSAQEQYQQQMQEQQKKPSKNVPDKRKAAPTRGKVKSGGTSLTPKDLFSMSDEEFEKLSIKDLV